MIKSFDAELEKKTPAQLRDIALACERVAKELRGLARRRELKEAGVADGNKTND